MTYFLAGYTCSFSLFAQRKRTKRKGTFSKVFFNEKERPVATLAHNNLQHVPKRTASSLGRNNQKLRFPLAYTISIYFEAELVAKIYLII
jgi:hypothetical protein